MVVARKGKGQPKKGRPPSQLPGHYLSTLAVLSALSLVSYLAFGSEAVLLRLDAVSPYKSAAFWCVIVTNAVDYGVAKHEISGLKPIRSHSNYDRQ